MITSSKCMYENDFKSKLQRVKLKLNCININIFI